jgi:hypothetical protein
VHAVLVQAADHLCNVHGLGYSGNAHPAGLPDAVWGILRVRREEAETHLDSLRSDPLVMALMPA